jgi:uncharacterized protein
MRRSQWASDNRGAVFRISLTALLQFRLMNTLDIIWTALAFIAVAALYSTVGHGGASGYLAVMGWMGFTSAEMKPTALILNLVVAGLGSIRFHRAGAFRWNLFWPFIITSVPMAYIGGNWPLADNVYKMIVGFVLVLAALRLWLKLARDEHEQTVPLPKLVALGWGAAIGLLSGLVGVGGGIFLSPLLLLTRWSTAKQAAALSAPFIVINSISGLAGQLVKGHGSLPIVPWHVAIFAACVLIGGWMGSGVGSRRLGHIGLRRALAIVIFGAGIKMFVPEKAKPVAAPSPSATQTQR